MNSSRIDFVFRNDGFVSEMWNGFLAPDVVLEGTPSPPFPQLYVINTAPSFTPGEHWCVVFVFENFCEFFDSFGNPPEVFGLSNTIMQHCKHVISNSKKLQCFSSSMCGHYCIYYVSMRARGFSTSDVLSTFTDDCRQNDDWVFDWVAQRFGREFAEIQL
jgi:hypothetical protein